MSGRVLKSHALLFRLPFFPRVDIFDEFFQFFVVLFEGSVDPVEIVYDRPDSERFFEDDDKSDEKYDDDPQQEEDGRGIQRSLLNLFHVITSFECCLK